MLLPFPLLAQLVAPPLQQGPARLPEQAPLQQLPARGQDRKPVISEPGPSDGTRPAAPAPAPAPQAPGRAGAIPPVQGRTPYSSAELETILRGCTKPRGSASASREGLIACAAALTARLTADGYINSRVFISPTPTGEGLEVVEGKIAEIRITCPDDQLAALARRKLSSLIGSVLHLPSLQRQLLLLKDVTGVGQVRGNLGKLGSDPTQAVLLLSLESQAPPWQGLIELRNDGDGGTGQWRSVATVLKNDLALRGDTFLIYGELDGTSTPELGSAIGSISYSFPLNSSLRFTDSFGISRRQMVEASGVLNTLSYRQLQNLAQLEWTFKDSLTDRWYAFAGLSANRNDGFLQGLSAPVVQGGGARWLADHRLPPRRPWLQQHPGEGHRRRVDLWPPGAVSAQHLQPALGPCLLGRGARPGPGPGGTAGDQLGSGQGAPAECARRRAAGLLVSHLGHGLLGGQQQRTAGPARFLDQR